MRLLRYVWALPNTLIGLALTPFVLMTGGHIQVVDGVLEVYEGLASFLLHHCVPLRGGALAITLGHVVLGRDPITLLQTRAHEREHVRQYELWGPAFIPAYLVAGLYALVARRGAYSGNYFEGEAVTRIAEAEGGRVCSGRCRGIRR